jgi:hypothetical protein
MTDIISTVKHVMEHLIPEDSESSDSVHHQSIRQLTTNPLDTPDDEDFTKEETLAMLGKFSPHKALGEDGLNRDILLKIFKRFPTFFTELYNQCLRKGYFPKLWKHSTVFSVVKPGKDGSTEVTKYRPISLLNVAEKFLKNCLSTGLTIIFSPTAF